MKKEQNKEVNKLHANNPLNFSDWLSSTEDDGVIIELDKQELEYLQYLKKVNNSYCERIKKCHTKMK